MVPLHKLCVCGATAWDTQHPQGVPRYTEELICPGCGRDNSRKPSLRLRWLYFRYIFSKRHRVYGLRVAVRHLSWTMFLLEREQVRRGIPSPVPRGKVGQVK